MFTKLLVSGMSCQHCKHSIEDTLRSLEGVNKAEANYIQGFVEVDFDTAIISLEKIAAEIAELGYEVKYN